MQKFYSLDRIRELSEGDTDFEKDMVSAFLEEIPKDLGALQEAFRFGNKELVYYYAHKMKPNLIMFGLNLEAAIKDIESWAGNADREDTEMIEGRLKHVDEVLQQTFVQLKVDFNS